MGFSSLFGSGGSTVACTENAGGPGGWWCTPHACAKPSRAPSGCPASSCCSGTVPPQGWELHSESQVPACVGRNMRRSPADRKRGLTVPLSFNRFQLSFIYTHHGATQATLMEQQRAMLFAILSAFQKEVSKGVILDVVLDDGQALEYWVTLDRKLGGLALKRISDEDDAVGLLFPWKRGVEASGATAGHHDVVVGPPTAPILHAGALAAAGSSEKAPASGIPKTLPSATQSEEEGEHGGEPESKKSVLEGIDASQAPKVLEDSGNTTASLTLSGAFSGSPSLVKAGSSEEKEKENLQPQGELHAGSAGTGGTGTTEKPRGSRPTKTIPFDSIERICAPEEMRNLRTSNQFFIDELCATLVLRGSQFVTLRFDSILMREYFSTCVKVLRIAKMPDSPRAGF